MGQPSGQNGPTIRSKWANYQDKMGQLTVIENGPTEYQGKISLSWKNMPTDCLSKMGQLTSTIMAKGTKKVVRVKGTKCMLD